MNAPSTLAGVPPPAPEFERSRLFRCADGDRIEDAGVIVVAGGLFSRTESFESVRRVDGGRTVTSVIVGSSGTYRVEGRWTYRTDETAQAATGLANYGGTPATVDISLTDTVATIRVCRDTAMHHDIAPCHSCLIDLAPSALPMFAMTRLYDPAQGAVQSFDWIGRGLVQDSVLTDGRADLRKLRNAVVPGPDGALMTVAQYHFQETLKDPSTGRVIRISFNLYVDGLQRPLGFGCRAMGTNAIGLRSGYEDLVERMPPQFDPDGAP
jgi:hypothetical protein